MQIQRGWQMNKTMRESMSLVIILLKTHGLTTRERGHCLTKGSIKKIDKSPWNEARFVLKEVWTSVLTSQSPVRHWLWISRKHLSKKKQTEQR